MVELLRMRSDEEWRKGCAARAAAGVREHYSAAVMARRAVDVYRRVSPPPAEDADSGSGRV